MTTRADLSETTSQDTTSPSRAPRGTAQPSQAQPSQAQPSHAQPSAAGPAKAETANGGPSSSKPPKAKPVAGRSAIILMSLTAFAATYLTVLLVTRDDGTRKDRGAHQQPSAAASAPSAARQQFVQQVNKLCAEQPGTTPAITDPKQAASAIATFFDGRRQLLSRIEAVPAPAEDRAAFTAGFVTPTRERLNRATPLLRDLSGAATADDQVAAATALSRLVQVSTPAPAELEFARTLGVTACVS